MTNATKKKVLQWGAIAIDVGIPMAATLSQFPIWVDRSVASTISGLCLFLVALSCIPFYRQIKEYMKSPSAPVLWSILFVLFAILENIASEIKIVCFFGALANYLGTAIFRLAENIGNREETEEEA